jgi:hypothetical protein
VFAVVALGVSQPCIIGLGIASAFVFGSPITTAAIVCT